MGVLEERLALVQRQIDVRALERDIAKLWEHQLRTGYEEPKDISFDGPIALGLSARPWHRSNFSVTFALHRPSAERTVAVKIVRDGDFGESESIADLGLSIVPTQYVGDSTAFAASSWIRLPRQFDREHDALSSISFISGESFRRTAIVLTEEYAKLDAKQRSLLDPSVHNILVDQNGEHPMLIDSHVYAYGKTIPRDTEYFSYPYTAAACAERNTFGLAATIDHVARFHGLLSDRTYYSITERLAAWRLDPNAAISNDELLSLLTAPDRAAVISRRRFVTIASLAAAGIVFTGSAALIRTHNEDIVANSITRALAGYDGSSAGRNTLRTALAHKVGDLVEDGTLRFDAFEPNVVYGFSNSGAALREPFSERRAGGLVSLLTAALPFDDRVRADLMLHANRLSHAMHDFHYLQNGSPTHLYGLPLVDAALALERPELARPIFRAADWLSTEQKDGGVAMRIGDRLLIPWERSGIERLVKPLFQSRDIYSGEVLMSALQLAKKLNDTKRVEKYTASLVGFGNALLDLIDGDLVYRYVNYASASPQILNKLSSHGPCPAEQYLVGKLLLSLHSVTGDSSWGEHAASLRRTSTVPPSIWVQPGMNDEYATQAASVDTYGGVCAVQFLRGIGDTRAADAVLTKLIPHVIPDSINGIVKSRTYENKGILGGVFIPLPDGLPEEIQSLKTSSLSLVDAKLVNVL